MSNSNKQINFIPFLDQNYEDIQRECLEKQCLFIDTKFCPQQTFIIDNEIKKNIIWQRPYDVTNTPKFFVKTPHRRDPSQGELSDCWFIVAIANITLHQQIFERVVPLNQTFDKQNGYTGLFHFHFWQYGSWYDVVIDDYLPFYKKTIQPWCSWNRQELNEFWVALIEKAYAKLNGGYRNLIGGAPIEAFTDLTAGVEQRFKLNETIKERKHFFNFLIDSLKHSCLMACSINPKSDGSDFEEIKPNGLVVGHSYSITAARYLQFKKKLLRMIRLRNPWANEIEWAGAWHDGDIRWNDLDLDEKRRMSWQDSEDGEFWMTFQDFFAEFDILEICHLSPDTFKEEFHLNTNSSQVSSPINNEIITSSIIKNHQTSIRMSIPTCLITDYSPIQHKTWSCLLFEGQWIKNFSSGGRCITTCEHGCNFWKNPQYEIETNAQNETIKCAIIISLMQKYNRLKTIDNPIDRYDYIQARIYKIKTNNSTSISLPSQSHAHHINIKTYGNDDLEYIGYTGSYINRREVTLYLRVPPGKYLVIPSTYEPNRDGHFLLRIFLETNYSIKQLPTILSSSSLNLNEQLTRLTISTPINSSLKSILMKNIFLNCLCPYDYQAMFKTKRKEHHYIIQTLGQMQTDVKRYKAVQMLLDQIFQVLNSSRIALTSAGFVPSISSFPTEETVREQLSLLLENVLFLGDLALFFPDVFHRFYDQDQQRRILTSWSYSFAAETEFYDEKSLEILSLMAQELNLIEKSPSFHNPYVFKQKDQQKKQFVSVENQQEQVQKKKSKEKIKKKREQTNLQRRSTHMSRHTICGVIENLNDNCVLDSGDVVIVTLCDTTLWDWTRIDFPHIPQRFIVSNVKLDNCDYFPIPFTLYYNAEEIDKNLCYGIRCDILDKDQQVKYSSEKFIDVLTDKYPKTNINIIVVPSDVPSTTTTNDKTDEDD
ncbi:unnamed protein product [Rotaria sordida]|uniref:Calpain catalytic domain-containing protein n=1 Tax=Rotaria sordida TaxID=392033 RepID=A0A818XDX8_9BILA|nr:unnamed protein product [Rotaria sordida]